MEFEFGAKVFPECETGKGSSKMKGMRLGNGDQHNRISTRPDEWLLMAVCQDPPDIAALDTLVNRHWNALFGRCLMLTLNHSDAADLAQSTWCRVLRSRKRLKPVGRFSGYLATIATNLWRDSFRASVRAGPLAENRLISLNAGLQLDDESTITLAETIADMSASHELERRHLAMDIDDALAGLPPLMREVLVARFINGESCAEIGRWHGRTQQTVSSWVRKATKQLKHRFKESEYVTLRTPQL